MIKFDETCTAVLANTPEAVRLWDLPRKSGTVFIASCGVAPPNRGQITVGLFEWTPTELGHDCIFMIVSANGDASNVDNIAAGDSIPEWRLVPNDNNMGHSQRVSGGGQRGTSGLTKNGLKSRVKSPNGARSRINIKATLPTFLAQRKWAVDTRMRGGTRFRSAPEKARMW